MNLHLTVERQDGRREAQEGKDPGVEFHVGQVLALVGRSERIRPSLLPGRLTDGDHRVEGGLGRFSPSNSSGLPAARQETPSLTPQRVTTHRVPMFDEGPEDSGVGFPQLLPSNTY